MPTTTVSDPGTDPEPRAAKPRLRGWLHLGMAPVILVAGLLLTATAPEQDTRLASAAYTLSAVMLFGTSAAYHRGDWRPKALAVFRRLDHANIFVFIAGTYTPLAFALLDGASKWSLVALAWGVAVLGVLFRLVWLGAPRWLYTVLYIGMGWMALGWLPQLWSAGGPAVVILVIAGGLVYTLGAVAYAAKRPNPIPGWFGFHEIFHTATIVAAICHLVAIWLAVFE